MGSNAKLLFFTLEILIGYVVKKRAILAPFIPSHLWKLNNITTRSYLRKGQEPLELSMVFDLKPSQNFWKNLPFSEFITRLKTAIVSTAIVNTSRNHQAYSTIGHFCLFANPKEAPNIWWWPLVIYYGKSLLLIDLPLGVGENLFFPCLVQT